MANTTRSFIASLSSGGPKSQANGLAAVDHGVGSACGAAGRVAVCTRGARALSERILQVVSFTKSLGALRCGSCRRTLTFEHPP